MEKQIYLYEEDISRFLYKRLIEMMYVPGEDEVDDIASILFDYLIDVGLLELESGDE